MATDRKIYVGNLPPNSNVRDIDKLFNCYGKIVDIDIKNRNGPPFAFIQFDDRRDAEDAVKGMDNYDLEGFSLRVEFPRDIKQTKKEYPSYSNYDTPRFVPHFEQYEMYTPFNYGHYQRNDRFQYYNDYHNSNYGGYTYPNRKARPTQSTDFRVFISNLPQYSNWQDVKDFMRRFGEVSYAEVFGNGKGVCDFVCKEDFKYVLSHVNNIKFKSTSGQTSYIKVEEDRSRRQSYHGRPSKSHKNRPSRSRSRSHSVMSKSSHSSKRRASSSSSDHSFGRCFVQGKSREVY